MPKKEKTKEEEEEKLKPSTLREAVYLAKKDFPKLYKETDGFNYKYANLPTMMETLGPILEKYKLDIRHEPIGKLGTEKSFVGVKTIITHMPTLKEDSVEFAHLASTEKPQEMGSFQTYYRRYNLLCYFNLMPEKKIDDDGEMVQDRSNNNNNGRRL